MATLDYLQFAEAVDYAVTIMGWTNQAQFYMLYDLLYPEILLQFKYIMYIVLMPLELYILMWE